MLVKTEEDQSKRNYLRASTADPLPVIVVLYCESKEEAEYIRAVFRDEV